MKQAIAKAVKAVKDAIVQPAPKHVEQTLEEFMKDVELPKTEERKEEKTT